MKSSKYILIYTILTFTLMISLGLVYKSNAGGLNGLSNQFSMAPPDTSTQEDELKFPISDDQSITPVDPNYHSPLFLKQPSNIQTVVDYDPITKEYVVREQVAGVDNKIPVAMNYEEYSNYQLQLSKRNYWRSKKMGTTTSEQSFIPSINIRSEAFDKIFGSNTINITPQGSAELIFGYQMNRNDNPTFTEKMRRNPSFNFDEKIQMNVNGTIGDRMKLGINYNTEASFEFENETNLEFKGDEDDIIKNIEAGNLSFSLPGTLIPGSQNLFGLRTDLQFGKLEVATVFSQQKSESSSIQVQGGAQVSEFEVDISDYDANRHFLLAHCFRENYDDALSNLPLIQSGIEIREIEVWVTNKNDYYEGARNVVAFLDLAEIDSNISIASINPKSFVNPEGTKKFTYNTSNDLYERLLQDSTIRNFSKIDQTINENFGGAIKVGAQYEKIERARKLDTRDYNINNELGYISLNSSLNNDEILAVAFTYKILGQDSIYKVGELSRELPAEKPLIVKLLKGTNLSPKYKTWDLMMKNVYSIGAYQVQKEDFKLNVMYRDDRQGRPLMFIPEAETEKNFLIRVLGMDTVNFRNEPYPDGIFDFIPGITILPNNGRVIFTTLKPFDTKLKKFFEGKISDSKKLKSVIEKYTFPELYSQTKTHAEQIAQKNKFMLMGKYKSSSGSEIQLNAMNVPRGSVRVTAGGISLTEGTDFTVDYTLGRVKIINNSILESGTPINISLESNALFNFQTKTLFGTHLNYKFSEDFNIGGTFLHLNERPLTKKVNMGDEPISNTIFGLNTSLKQELPFLTRAVDLLPFIETKAPSMLTFDAEFAQIVPGAARAIRNNNKQGVAYLDDFEGSETSIDLTHPYSWKLASTPYHDVNPLFPEADSLNSLAYNYNRAKIAWYIIDPLFNSESGSLRPDHIKKDDQSNHLTREVYEQEIWPLRDNENNIPTRVSPMNLAYYPDERGPYNFDTDPTSFSAGLGVDGKLHDPETRWGGIMRGLTSSDFEQQNVEFIEFWIMDPYAMDTGVYNLDKDKYGKEPYLYLDLGDISEDILKDGLKSFEQGLPTSDNKIVPLDTTKWGIVSRLPAIVDGFDADPDTRSRQDVGLDGQSSDQEKSFFGNYVNWVSTNVDAQYSGRKDSLLSDPAGDDYNYFRSTQYDNQKWPILDRYKFYNNMEGNSKVFSASDEAYPTSGQLYPDQEDINDDNTLNYTERFYEYRVSLHPDSLKEGTNHIADISTYSGRFANNKQFNVRWLQFKIPLDEYLKAVGGIDDFKSIRFVRLYMSGVKQPLVLRFATLDLIRSNWRRFDQSLYDFNEALAGESVSNTRFSVSAINVEENGNRYYLPWGFDREIDPGNPQLTELNEQSMLFKIEDLDDGDARAAYKNVNLDLRKYKNLEMEVHAEKLEGFVDDLADGDLTVFIRIGSDFTENYYEYEVPMKVTDRNDILGTISTEINRKKLWPEENRIFIDLEKLINVKKLRNELINNSSGGIYYMKKFEDVDGNNKIYVKGNPSLSNIRTLMIGVRNTNRKNYLKETNDQRSKSAEIWINELRLSDFKDKSGWAANARAKANLADFGSISLATSYSTPGFGTIEQKVNERAQEASLRYDAAGNLELGKFFNESAGVSIPMYAGYSKAQITPEYDPEDPDVKLAEKLRSVSRHQKDSIILRTLDETINKSLNFNNVRVNKKSKTPRFYDPANISLSYAYREQLHHDIETEEDLEKNYKATLNYIYSKRTKLVQPFKSSKLLKPKAFSIIKDFNFYYLPSKISFSTNLNREYGHSKIRVYDESITSIFRDYTLSRSFDLKYDLSRSLTFDFSSDMMTRFDENQEEQSDFGFLGFFNIPLDTNQIENVSSLGRPLSYNHTLNIGYKVPINKLPLLDFTSLSTKYSGKYNWVSGPRSRNDNQPELGNTIISNYDLSFSNSNRLSTLYGKVKYLKTLDQKYSKTSSKKKKEYETVQWVAEGLNVRANMTKALNHKLKSEDIQVKAYSKDGTEIPCETTVVNHDKVRVTFTEDLKDLKIVVEAKKEKKTNAALWISDHALMMLIGLKDISANYSIGEGVILPGYTGTPYIGGLNSDFSSPSWKILGGMGARDIKILDDNEQFNYNNYLSAVSITEYEKIDGRATYEPFKGFRIMFNLNYSDTKTSSLNYVTGSNFEDQIPAITTENITLSTITLNTIFDGSNSKNSEASKTFDQFINNVSIISQRLGSRAIDNNWYNQYNSGVYRDEEGNVDPNYKGGFGPSSQKVLVPAFISAYHGSDPTVVSIDKSTPQIPLPNWQMSYDGLAKIPWIKKYAKSVNLSHSYRSKYNVNGIQTNESFGSNEFGIPGLDLQGNFAAPITIGSISIDEQFAPLVGVDISWVNSLITKIEFKKTRRSRLNFANTQIMEDLGQEFVMGLGYSIKDFKLAIDAGSGLKEYKSDLVLRADLSFRDNKSVIRTLTLDEENKNSVISGGEGHTTIKFTADYAMSENFNLSFYYTRESRKPHVSTSYPNANTNIGFSIRFTLVQ